MAVLGSVSLRRAFLAAVLVASVIALAVEPARATPTVTKQRLGGENRYATAAGAAVAAYPDGAESVVLASGDAFPDALSGAALAGANGGPIVLTARDRLSPEAEAAIDELGAERIVILGGPAAVSEAAEGDLGDRTVIRIAGDDRYATSAKVAQAIGSAAIANHQGKRTALVASGTSFADALAGGAIAGNGAGAGVHPILLVGSSVSEDVAVAIDELAITQVIILGGTAAVSPAVETQLEVLTGNPAIRYAGNNRYETARVVADALVTEFGSPATTALITNGERFADALGGSSLAAVRHAPILLTPQALLADASYEFLSDRADTVASVLALGGTAAVSEAALEQAQEAAETGTEEDAAAGDDISVTPASAASQNNNTSRAYTATGLSGIDAVDIVLLPCANVKSSSGGGRTYANTNRNGIADGGANAGSTPDKASTVAAITRINGASASLTNNDYANDVQPNSSGTVTFSISGPSSTTASGGCVRPVVFHDADDDAALDVAAENPGAATEDNGAGGTTTFSPSSTTTAPGGTTIGARDVSRQNADDEAKNQFEACVIENTDPELANPDECQLYVYDEHDTFKIGTTVVGIADFEKALSPGDDISSTGGRYYPPATIAASTFALTDESPLAPTDTAATQEDNGDVTVSFREPLDEYRDRFLLYRVAKGSGDCPEPRSSYAVLAGSVDPNPLPGTPNEITDTEPTPGTATCYIVVTEHERDESDASPAASITPTGEAPPSDDPGLPGIVDVPDEPPAEVPDIGGGDGGDPDETAPTILESKVTVDAPTSGQVSAGDTHRFTFSEPMAESIETRSGYRLEKGPTNILVACGGASATCELSPDGTILTVSIANVAVIGAGAQYPVEIATTQGFVDEAGNEVDLDGSETELDT